MTIVGCTTILGVRPIPDLAAEVADAAEAGDAGDTAIGSGDAMSDGGVDAEILPLSCQDGGGPGITSCGPDGGESCCASLGVPGGMFLRSYDAVTFVDSSSPATVSALRLDRFEVTTARFRRFVTAIGKGWKPKLYDGRHTHLNGGMGLVVSPDDAGIQYENGWDISWNDTLVLVAGPDAGLACGDWTSAPGPNESLPIGCVSWFEAFAFCIWDGGFLPSEAEWAFAAAGGEQRVFPWSTNPPTSTRIDCTFANYGRPNGCTDAGFTPPGALPRGDGKWGHADLAGNAYEWVLDALIPYGNPCHDCVSQGAQQVLRGGAFPRPEIDEHVGNRYGGQPDFRGPDIGVRCARVP
jgi:formylglycine-generating enzyme required for sulfatase activity